MATYRELLARVREEIEEISTVEAHERLRSEAPPLFVDVRPPDEWQEGHIPGALLAPRNNLESRFETLVPDHERAIVVYCSGGTRSAFAAKTLEELGYERMNAEVALETEPDRPVEHGVSAFLTDRLLDWIDRQDQPWFAHASYLRPHPPYAAAGHWSMALRSDGLQCTGCI